MQVRRSCRHRTADHNESLLVSSLKVQPVVSRYLGWCRAEQAAEYERLLAERERPCWREYNERGAFISARIFRAAFGTDPRQDIAKYVIAVEVPATPGTASTTLIPVPGVQPARRRIPAGGSARVRRTGAARCLTGTAHRRLRRGATMRTTRSAC